LHWFEEFNNYCREKRRLVTAVTAALPPCP
jgi:hypothetical protein